MYSKIVACLALVALAEARVNSGKILPAEHFPEGHFSIREPDLGRKLPSAVPKENKDPVNGTHWAHRWHQEAKTHRRKSTAVATAAPAVPAAPAVSAAPAPIILTPEPIIAAAAPIIAAPAPVVAAAAPVIAAPAPIIAAAAPVIAAPAPIIAAAAPIIAAPAPIIAAPAPIIAAPAPVIAAPAPIVAAPAPIIAAAAPIIAATKPITVPLHQVPTGSFRLRVPDEKHHVVPDVPHQDPLKMAMKDAKAAVGAATSASVQAFGLKAPSAQNATALKVIKAPSAQISDALGEALTEALKVAVSPADKSREQKGALTKKLGGDKDGNAFDADYILHRPNAVAPGDSKLGKPIPPGVYHDIAKDNGTPGVPPPNPKHKGKGPRMPSRSVRSLSDQIRHDNYETMTTDWGAEYGPDGPKGTHATHQRRPLKGWGPMNGEGTPQYAA